MGGGGGGGSVHGKKIFRYRRTYGSEIAYRPMTLSHNFLINHKLENYYQSWELFKCFWWTFLLHPFTENKFRLKDITKIVGQS